VSGLSQRAATAVTAVVALAGTATILAVESLVSGPPFLAIYAALIAVLCGVLRVVARQTDPAEVPPGQWTDPYLLAYLSGGPDLALRTVALSLVDRGLLHANGPALSVAVPGAAALVQRPVEQRLLQVVGAGADARSILQSGTLHDGCEDIQRQLRQARLIEIGPARLGSGLLRSGIAATALLMVAVARIVLAASRGQHKIGYLIALTLLGLVLVFSSKGGWSSLVSGPSRTRAGETLLADMRQLFGTLPLRAGQIQPGGGTSELSFLVALYGLAAAPAFASSTLQSWMPPAHVAPAGMAGAESSSSWDTSGSSSSSSSSCSSSSCSSSSCGGGGGCGGCGS